MQKSALLGLLALLLCAITPSCQHQNTAVADPSPSLSPATTAPPSPPPLSEAGFVETKREGAPLSLTTADGTGLKLVDLHAQAMLEGPLAFTELHLTFENPEDRVLEGRFEITLPDWNSGEYKECWYGQKERTYRHFPHPLQSIHTLLVLGHFLASPPPTL